MHERDVHVCATVEGNTNDDGSSHRAHDAAEGPDVPGGGRAHRFIRWAEMVRKAVAA